MTCLMYYTDDPIADFNRWDRERQREYDRLPKCKGCGEGVYPSDAVCIDDDYYHSDCFDEGGDEDGS